MITIEQKIEQFRRMVLGHAEHALEEKVALLDQRDIKALEEMKHELESLGSSHIEEHMTLAIQERKRQLAKAKIEKSHALLKEKEVFVKHISDDLKKMAIELTTESTYKQRLFTHIESCIAGINPSERVVLYLSARDIESSKEIKTHFSAYADLRVEQSAYDLLGGFVLESQTSGVRYDGSYLSKIEHSSSITGGRLFELLNEEGMKHD